MCALYANKCIKSVTEDNQMVSAAETFLSTAQNISLIQYSN